jgi:hypothetical protein
MTDPCPRANGEAVNIPTTLSTPRILRKVDRADLPSHLKLPPRWFIRPKGVVERSLKINRKNPGTHSAILPDLQQRIFSRSAAFMLLQLATISEFISVPTLYKF